MKCKHREICNHYDKDSYTCKRQKKNTCGIFRWIEKEIICIKKLNKKRKKEKNIYNGCV